MKSFGIFGVLAVLAFGLGACGDGGSTNAVGDTPSSSATAAFPPSSSEAPLPPSSATESSSSGIPSDAPSESSSSTEPDSADSSSATAPSDTAIATKADTVKITYRLKPYDGPLPNPHKGFTVPVGGTWAFVEEFQYGPYGSLNNRAWDLITYGSGYFQWNKLNPEKGVYDWSSVDKLLEACEKNGLGYALRVLPYTPSFIKSDDTPEENYDWTPQWVYREGAKKITATLTSNGYRASVPVWDDPIYLQAAKDFAVALAEKYDGDPRLEYIDIRTFGEWGEWHASHLDGSEMPNDSIEMDMLDHYAKLFKKTLIVLPSNGHGDVYTHALNLGIAKRDDGFIGNAGRADSLVRCYKAGLPTIAENLGGYQMMLGYDDISHYKWTPERWVNDITKAHLTFYVLDQDSDDGYYFYLDNKELADSMTHIIGYNFTVSEAELTTVTGDAGSSSTLNITVRNSGIAPCFFDVYMVAEFVDSTGMALTQLGKTIHIPKASFKDDSSKDFSFTYTATDGNASIAKQEGISVALSLYESEESFRNGKNPTVRFDNEGLQENRKLLLIP